MDEYQTVAAIDAGRQIGQKIHANTNPHGAPFVVGVGPSGESVLLPIDGQLSNPFPLGGKAGTALFHDMQSFLSYWHEHNEPRSRMYAELEPAVTFTAVFDEHVSGVGGEPGWREHRAIYKPKHSREWTTWMERNKKQFDGNYDFAVWLEDNIPDVVNPDGSTLLEIARTFRVDERVKWGNAVNLNNGEVDIGFQRVLDSGAQSKGERVKIPELFDLNIPVWAGVNQRRYDMRARFRYRLREENLAIWFDLIRPHKVVEQAFMDLLSDLTEAGPGPYFGSPSR